MMSIATKTRSFYFVRPIPFIGQMTYTVASIKKLKVRSEGMNIRFYNDIWIDLFNKVLISITVQNLDSPTTPTKITTDSSNDATSDQSSSDSHTSDTGNKVSFGKEFCQITGLRFYYVHWYSIYHLNSQQKQILEQWIYILLTFYTTNIGSSLVSFWLLLF